MIFPSLKADELQDQERKGSGRNKLFQFGHRSYCLLNRCFAINAVAVVQVNMVDSEPFQAFDAALLDIFWITLVGKSVRERIHG